MKKAILILTVAATLFSCKKEQVLDPDTEPKTMCFECVTMVTKTNPDNTVDTLSSVNSSWCNVNRLWYARKQVELDKWVTVAGIQGKQAFICELKK